MSATTPGGATAAAGPAMREAYRDLLVELMAENESLICLDSDTGLFAGADFGPAAERYVNVGIAEHTMMGAAAGLAREGRIVMVNTMAAFASSRAIEAVKIDIALNDLPVRIMATHAGVSAGHLGPTHHGLEDIAAMRVLPNMTVVVPADTPSAVALFTQALQVPGPVYFRLGRGATPDLPVDGRSEPPEPPRLGQAQVLATGFQITIAACGPHPVLIALAAAEELAAEGIGAHVLNVHTVKPLDVGALADSAAVTGNVITIEEAWGAGGFGSAVAEALCGEGLARIQRVAVGDAFVEVAGDQKHLLGHVGITTRAVVQRARDMLGRNEP